MGEIAYLADVSMLTTLSTDEAMETLAQRFEALGIAWGEVKANEKGTLFAVPASEDVHWLRSLPALSLVEEKKIEGRASGGVTDLVVGEILGEGGMGVVRSALQVPLHREVAVKRLRVEKNSRAEILSLLREAWVTGMLEHPNIVPVYALGRDAEDRPIFVMKRIGGVPWQDLMFSPEHPYRIQDKRSSLLWNLDVLMQVCRSVHFAHSKGILHRDIKPSNVMIGEFGEVYLLDWGIALALSPHPSLPLPLAAEVARLEGTPAYMAPEMAAVHGERIGVQTDVYLLGGVLHEILTGKPPHQGPTLLAVLADAMISAPHTYASDIPESLVAICHRAMNADPAARFESVEAFRCAIADFLQQKNSIDLTEEAKKELQDLQGKMENEKEKTDLRSLFFRLGELRFGFHQALHLWPENREAAEGLRACMVLTCQVMIADAYLEAAEQLFNEIEQPPESLRAALEALREQKEQQEKHRMRLELDTDSTVGRRTRRFIVTVMAIFFVPFWLFFGQIFPLFSFQYTTYFSLVVGEIVFFGAFSVWARDTMTRNAINRRVLLAIWLFVLSGTLWFVYAWFWRMPIEQTLAVHLLLQSSIFGVLALLTELALLWSVGVGALCFVGVMLWPRWVYEWMALSLGAGLLQAAYVWKPKGPLSRIEQFLERWRTYFSC